MRRTIAVVASALVSTTAIADPPTPPPVPPVEPTPDAPPTEPVPPPVEPTQVPIVPAPRAAPPSTPPPATYDPAFVMQPGASSATPAWIVSGVAVGLAIAAGAWWLYSDHYVFGSHETSSCVPNFVMGVDLNNCPPPDEAGVSHRQRVWFDTEAALGVATVAATIAAAYLWSQHGHTLQRVAVTPTASGGAAVILGGRF